MESVETMSQQGNFLGGFLLGTVVGGVVGGVVGTLAATRLAQEAKLESKTDPKPAKKRQLKAVPEQNMELARRGLEDKIAQLNDAIDDVRQQLGTVNGSESTREPSIRQEL
jgi:gas vesicle protein